MSKTKIIISVILLFTLAAANAWNYWLKPAPMAPKLTLQTINGQNINLQALQGKPVLFSFWATSCGLCLMEINDLVALHKAYQAQGYTTLAVALSYDSLPTIKTMTEDRSLPYQVIFDQQGKYAEAFGGVYMTPTHFLISPDGKIIWQNIGPIDRTELQGLIESLLAKGQTV